MRPLCPPWRHAARWRTTLNAAPPCRHTRLALVASLTAGISALCLYGCDYSGKIVDNNINNDPCVEYTRKTASLIVLHDLEVSKEGYHKVTMPVDSVMHKTQSSPLEFNVLLRDVITGQPAVSCSLSYGDKTFVSGDNGIVNVKIPNSVANDECTRLSRLAVGELPQFTLYMVPKVSLDAPYNSLLGFAVGLEAEYQLGIRDRAYTPEELIASGKNLYTLAFNTQTPSRIVFTNTDGVSVDLINDLKNLIVGGNVANYIDPRERPASYWDDFHPLSEIFGRQIFVYEPDTVNLSKQNVIRFNQERSECMRKGVILGGKPLEYNLLFVQKNFSYPQAVKFELLHELEHLLLNGPHSRNGRHLLSALKANGTGHMSFDEALLFIFCNMPVWNNDFSTGNIWNYILNLEYYNPN